MAQTVAETLVGVLEHIGVKQIFALIEARRRVLETQELPFF